MLGDDSTAEREWYRGLTRVCRGGFIEKSSQDDLERDREEEEREREREEREREIEEGEKRRARKETLGEREKRRG